MHLDQSGEVWEPVTFEAWAERGITCEELLEERGTDLECFVDQDGEMFSEFLYVGWDAAQIEEGLAGGASEFTVTGKYISSPNWDWSEDFKILWEEGRILVPEEFTPRLTIHVRPEDLVTIYTQGTEYSMGEVTVRRSTPFEEAGLARTEWLRQEESPYEKTHCEFTVVWNQEEYAEGIESGADAFIISGRYDSCVDESYRSLQEQGLIRVETGEVPRLQVYVQGRPEAPMIYCDPTASPFYIAASSSDTLASLNLPESKTLCLEGTTPYSNTRDFAIRWNEKEYQAGLASGKESFLVNGTYVPDLLDGEEKGWWEEGYIGLSQDIEQPTAQVTVVKGSRLLFRVTLKPMDAEETKYFPVFKFPCLRNAERVTCAYSTDKITWYEYEVPDYEWNRYEKEASVIIPFMNEAGNLMSIQPEAPGYFKMIITGSSMEGETGIFAINEPSSEEGGLGNNENSVIDKEDPYIGDRGGGGQGEHDRDHTAANPDTQEDLAEDGGENPAKEPSLGDIQESRQEDFKEIVLQDKVKETAGAAAEEILAGEPGSREAEEGREQDVLREEQKILAESEEETPYLGLTKAGVVKGRQVKAGLGIGSSQEIPGYLLGAAGTAIFIIIGAGWVYKKNRK